MAEGVESTTIIPAKPPADFLTSDGRSVPNAGAELGAIFDLAEQGKPIREAIEETSSKKASPPRQQEEVEKEPAVEEKEEKKEVSDGKSLEDALSEAQDDKDEEVSREALLKASEPKVRAKVEDKPAEKEDKEDKATDPADEIPEDEQKVLPYDKPRTAKRIEAILKKSKALEDLVTTTKKEADEKAAKLAEYEKTIADFKSVNPETDERVKAKLDELAMFRRRYELDNDPTVKERFDSRTLEAEASITAILKERQASPALLKLIEDNGGWAKFSTSNAPVTYTNSSGEQETITAAEASESILSALPIMDRKKVEVAMIEQIQTTRDRARFFADEAKKATEFFSKREQEQAAESEKRKAAMEDAQKIVTNFQKEAVEKHEWLKEKEIPSDAAPEVKAQIQEDNRYNRQLLALLKKNVSVTDIPSMLGVVEDSVAYYAERRTSARLLAEVAALKEGLAAQKESHSKFLKASRSVSKTGSLSSSIQQQQASEKKGPPGSLEDAFAAIERGEKL